MDLPDEIKKAADDALELVSVRKDHEFGPQARGTLFATMRNFDEAIGVRAITWIGILCAKHVLYLFEDVVQKKSAEHWDGLHLLPFKSITMAEGVMEGRIAKVGAYDYACDSHYDVEHMQADLPLRAHLANRAANLALTEAAAPRGDYDPFGGLADLAFENNRIVSIKAVSTLDHLTSDEFTDAIWSMTSQCDVSAAASTAWSYVDDLYVADSVRLFEFWKWWFSVALSDAWQRATKVPD